jgi:hypothetical protein
MVGRIRESEIQSSLEITDLGGRINETKEVAREEPEELSLVGV